MKKASKIFAVAVALLCTAAGCTAKDTPTETAATQTAAATATSQPTITPEPTAVQTTQPESSQTPESTVESTTQPEPTLTPTTEQTSVPEGATTVAEGFYYTLLTDEIRERITGISYPAEGESCAITYDDLNYIRLLYVDFEGETHEGEMIVNAKVAQEVTEIFLALYEAAYPLESVRLVSDFGEPFDDNLSMAANNTSSFCYRQVTGSSKLSRHSYGAAIDINPVQNPYIDGDRVAPSNAAEYVDRSQNLPGMIDHDDLAYQLFTQYGWTWGGDWSGDKDYQHFSKDLGY